MSKLFLLGLLVFLTGCATTCGELKLEKERKKCYDDARRNQQRTLMDRDYFWRDR
jgi:hypothetical protein